MNGAKGNREGGGPAPGAAGGNGDVGSRARLREAQGRLFFAWLFTLPILLMMGASRAFGAPWPSPFLHRLAMLVLAFPVLFVIGLPAFEGALEDLRNGRAGLDLIVALATLVAYGSGLVALLAPLDGHAGVAAVLMAVHVTGRHVQRRRGGGSQGR